jgi:intein/homing endonuclease
MNDLYTKGKQGVFSQIYGGTEYTLQARLGIGEDVATQAKKRWEAMYPGIKKAQREINEAFCVVADTWVHTIQGPRLVRDLDKPFIALVNGERYKASGFWSTGKTPVVQITTRDGYSVKLTKDHRVLVNRFQNLKRYDLGLEYWVEAQDLKPGDTIVLHRHSLDWVGDGTWSEGYILGWLLGDGSITVKDNRLYVYKDDFQMLEFLCSQFEEYPNVRWVEQSQCYIIQSDELDLLIEQYGIEANRNYTRYMEEASADFQKGVISGLMDTDGSASSHCKEITLDSINFDKLIAVQRVLLRFGIVCNISKIKEDRVESILGRKVNVKETWRLYFGKANVEVFASTIGFQRFDKQEKCNKAISSCHPDKKYQETFLSEIENVTELGESEVFDVSVDRVARFDGNGFTLHNCSMRQP